GGGGGGARVGGEEGGEGPGLPLVERRQEAVDVAVRPGGGAARLLLAARAGTTIRRQARSYLRHDDAPPHGMFATKPWLLYAKRVNLFLNAALTLDPRYFPPVVPSGRALS